MVETVGKERIRFRLIPVLCAAAFSAERGLVAEIERKREVEGPRKVSTLFSTLVLASKYEKCLFVG